MPAQRCLAIAALSAAVAWRRVAADGRDVEAENATRGSNGIVFELAPRQGGTIALVANPMDPFVLDGSNMWAQWKGLDREIKLFEKCAVIAHYQISMYAETHLFSRLLINGKPVKDAGSGQSSRYATNIGFHMAELKAGVHTFKVEYRTKYAARFKPDGGDWQTRALNIMALPTAKIHFEAPLWSFKWSPTGEYTKVPGLDSTMSFANETAVLVVYSIFTQGVLGSMAAARLLRNGIEKKESRSAVSPGQYNYLFGFYLDTVPAGNQTWTVEYKSKGMDHFFQENDWMTRAINVIRVPGGESHVVYDASAFTTIGDARPHRWKGLAKTVKLTSRQHTIVMYNVAWSCSNPPINSGDILSYLTLGGVEQ